MPLLRRALLRLRAVLGRRTLESEMQHEMREHLDRATDRFVARGMTPEDARLAARREFGNVTVIEEEARDARGARWIDALGGDLRFAFRYFARHRGTVAIIVAVLALGTGANALIFSIYQSEFVRPAPAVPSNDGLARIWTQERATRTARWNERGFTYAELLTLAQRRDIFRDVAAWTATDVVLDAGDSTGARGVGVQFVTSNFFTTLGVRLVAGQGLALVPQAGVPEMSAVMSHALATTLYGDSARAIGRRIHVNETTLHIVGVAPARFQGAIHNMGEPALWIPLSARADVSGVSARWFLEEPALALFARVAPGVSHAQATALARQVVVGSLPDSASRVGMARMALVDGMQAPPPGDDSYEKLIAFTAIAGVGILILLVAWMNVSSLMVAAAVGRRHEIAVRLSLGASRARILRQLVTESTVLALTGGTIGLVLAWWQLMYMTKTEIDGVNIMPDAGTFAFTLGVAVSTGVVFGLSPALHATRGHLANALRDSRTGFAGRSRLQRGFVTAQIMLSQPLLVLLGAMLSLVLAEYRPMSPELSHRVISVGFHYLLRTGVPGARPEAVDSLATRVAQRPEVIGAVPDAQAFDVRGVVPTGSDVVRARADSGPTVIHVEGAAPGWLAMMDVPMLLGRDVSLMDTAATDYRVIIGSDLAHALWGDANPLGRVLASPPLPGLEQDSVMMTVVGVYDATHELPGMTFGGASATTNITSRAYTAHGKHWRHDYLLVRTRATAEPFVPELQRFIRATAPSLPVRTMRTLAQQDEERYRETFKMAAGAGAGGLLALLLASLGLYGVVSLAVQQRTREIGVRIAVGAHPTRVARMFLASGVRLGAIALFLGLPLSIAALKVGMSQGLFIAPGINVWLIGVAIAVILLAVASGATWIPARRAARVDPATTLRVE
ncbi:MAG TPA: ABC transporter permease [Gemmatimonadaceae bacterium]|nr:ABC transporter permease [Gemmatimonadaceae bacterium]